MITEKYPPISAGACVKTTQPNLDLRDEWTAEGWAKRKWGVKGTVITHHDSHGLCYDVRHEDGTQGCYDPSELEIVVASLTREEMIAKLEWNSGGFGFGVCSVAGSMIWSMDAPGPGRPDLKSIVAVSGPPDRYTDEELAKILAFAEEATARYDKMFRYRRGANLIFFSKPTEEGWGWLRKRLSWNQGPMYSPTLDEAIEFMRKNC